MLNILFKKEKKEKKKKKRTMDIKVNRLSCCTSEGGYYNLFTLPVMSINIGKIYFY